MAHVWEKSYPSGVYWDCSLAPAVTLGSLLETAATMWPDRMAVDFYDRTFTYRELHDLAATATTRTPSKCARRKRGQRRLTHL